MVPDLPPLLEMIFKCISTLLNYVSYVRKSHAFFSG